MEQEFWNKILLEVMQIAITAAIPVLGTMIALLLNKALAWMKVKLGQSRYDLAVQVVQSLVLAAEQHGVTGYLYGMGISKKDWVIEQAKSSLEQRGISLPLDELDTLVESAVMEIFNLAKDQIED